MPERPVQLRLYVAGRLPNSARALANLRAVCDEFFDGLCSIEVVDILQDPMRAIEDLVLVTPTLVVYPEPTVRIVGDLSDRSRLMDALQVRGPSPA